MLVVADISLLWSSRTDPVGLAFISSTFASVNIDGDVSVVLPLDVIEATAVDVGVCPIVNLVCVFGRITGVVVCTGDTAVVLGRLGVFGTFR